MILSALLAVAGTAWAEEPQKPVDASVPAAELAAFLAAQPRWSLQAKAESSIGYKDNLLLSRAAEESSAFARGAAEFFLMRVPRGPLDFAVFVNGDETRYFERDAVDHETNFWSNTEVGFRGGKRFKAALGLQAYYSDRVWDVSFLEAEREVAEVQGGGVGLVPSLRWNFPRGLWLEAHGVGKRELYRDGVYDSRVGEGALRVGADAGDRFEVSVAATRRWRNYGHRAQYSAAGRELPDTRLKIAEEEAQLRLEATWGPDKRWTTTTRASVLRYADNGPGFFNHAERRITQEIEWDGGTWLARLSGAAARTEFDVQTVGFGLRPPLRFEEEYSGELVVERKVSARWTVFARYAWERNRSNEFLASYVVNEGLLGARWSWEK